MLEAGRSAELLSSASRCWKKEGHSMCSALDGQQLNRVEKALIEGI